MPEPVLPPNPDVLTGNDAIIKIQGRIAGFGKSIQVSINNNVRPIERIGSRKPAGLKSLNWSGTTSMEFHILVTAQDGVIPFPTSDDERADDLYQIVVIHKKTQKRIGILIGAVSTEGFSLSNNDFSGRSIEFQLMDWKPLEGFN
ncbi:hypothetical protein [Leptospira levettii]|uniref:hypothetical protein n=1 Tax=Leptospira levettii TaxID=2023178 RepID=UPI000C2B4C92|nr:hypothetical protein [Leptospira levettii]PJZ89555.1 hypothetical protein CH368_06245 [Leptospira levettii]